MTYCYIMKVPLDSAKLKLYEIRARASLKLSSTHPHPHHFVMQISGTDGKKNVMELHISYHNGDHYNSVRRLGDCTSGPACIKLTTTTLPVAAAAVPKAAIKVLEDEEDEDEDEDEDKDARDDGFEAHHHLPSISSGQEGLSRVERELMEQTGCEDLAMVRAYLCAHDYEVREAADALINYIVHQHKGRIFVC